MATPAETLHKRRADWVRLEQMLGQVGARSLRGFGGPKLIEATSLYRSACADLAMAEQYRLSPDTVKYLHELVGRAHNTIYRSRRFQYQTWWKIVVQDAPQQIFHDRCVQLCAVLFFGLFTLSAFLAFDQVRFPGFGERMLGDAAIEQMEGSYSEVNFRDTSDRGLGANFMMVAYYIQHNTGIGLQCFAMGPLIIPGIYTTGYNATFLGAAFGFMARGDTEGGDAFLEFVIAHGAFELTAIALAAAAGLRIGTGWLFTRGMTRLASLQQRGREAIPVMAASGLLFFLAAMTEGLISPSSLPYFVKALWGIGSSALLMFYFVVLGYPSSSPQQGG